MYTHIHIFMHKYMYIYTYVYIHMRMYIYLYICMYAAFVAVVCQEEKRGKEGARNGCTMEEEQIHRLIDLCIWSQDNSAVCVHIQSHMCHYA